MLWLPISYISILVLSLSIWSIQQLVRFVYREMPKSSSGIIFILRLSFLSWLNTLTLSVIVIGSYYYGFNLFNSINNRFNAIRFIVRDNVFAILCISIGAYSYWSLLSFLIPLRNIEYISSIFSVFLLYSDKFYFESMKYVCWGNAVSILSHSSVSSTSIAVSPTQLQTIAIRCLIISLIPVIFNTFFESNLSVSFTYASLESYFSAWFLSFSLSLILCWLQAFFHFIVVAHPMDFSLLSGQSSDESLLISALQIGLFPTQKSSTSIPDKLAAYASTKGFSFSIFAKQVELAIITRSHANTLDLKAFPLQRESLDWNQAIQLMAAFNQSLKQECQGSSIVGFHSSAPPLLMGLSPTQQHWRVLAFQDLHRLATASNKQGKARRAKVYEEWLPSVVFACCAVIQAMVLQVFLMRERLVKLTTPEALPASSAAKKPISNWISQVLRSPVMRALQAVSAVGALAACIAQAVMRALGVLGPSLWVGTSTASLSAVVVAGLAVSVVRTVGVTPAGSAPKKTGEDSNSSTADKGVAGGTAVPAPGVVDRSLWLLVSWLGLQQLADNTVPVPQFISQTVCFAVEALAELLLHALREDASGMTGKYLFCVLDGLLQLEIALEDFLDTQLSTFQCSLPSSLTSRATFFKRAKEGGVNPGTDMQKIHFKLHTSSDGLSPPLQAILTCTRNALNRLVHAYSDVLSANYMHSQRYFSSMAVAEALKARLASE